MRFSMLIAIIFIILPLSDLYAGSIYSWTDKNGIKKYSNTAPEGEVRDLEVIEEIPVSETVDADGDIETVDADVDIEEDELSRHLKEVDARKIKEEQQRIDAEKEKNKIIEAKVNEKIQAEKERLLGEIDRIEKLAIGPSLSLARKNAMIKQFQDKLDLLEKSPEEYFRSGKTE